MTPLILNALDQSPITEGMTPAAAIAETIALARHCEDLGYHRYWVAEHHNTPAFAGSAPEVLLAHIAAHTRHIHIGSGGVMISHYSPLKIAEQFQLLSTLAPGRVDLGVGRAAGADPRTAAALQAGPRAWPPEAFPQQVQMIRQYLEDAQGHHGDTGGFPDDHPYQGIHAQPTQAPAPRLWVLGSGGDSALYAAHFGLPFVYADFIGGLAGRAAIALYREHFVPSVDEPKPVIAFAASVLAADSDEEAEHLAAPIKLWSIRHRQGHNTPLPSFKSALAYSYSDAERQALAETRDRMLIGTAPKILAQCHELAAHFFVDEFFLVTITPDAEARAHSYRLMMEANCQSQPVEASTNREQKSA